MTPHDLAKIEQRIVWDQDYSNAPLWVRTAIVVLRTLVYVYREFSSGELNLRAMSLVYTSILSLVPLLAFSFSVLKGFGVQNQAEPLLLEFCAALGPRESVEITAKSSNSSTTSTSACSARWALVCWSIRSLPWCKKLRRRLIMRGMCARNARSLSAS